MKLEIVVYSDGLAEYTVYESDGRRMWSAILDTQRGSFWWMLRLFFSYYADLGGTW